MLALSDVDLQTVGKAFDHAWDRYLRTGLLTRHNLTESRHILACRILRAARFGERDPWRLARDAVDYLLQVMAPRPAVPRPVRSADRRQSARRPARQRLRRLEEAGAVADAAQASTA
jgi:hypothetical protein